MLFGPAYKGIPLASVTSAAMFSIYRVSKGFAYDRKEKKAHGEGGNFIGTSLTGTSRRVLLIDDVITDGGTEYDADPLDEGETASKVVAILTVVDRIEQTKTSERFFRRSLESKRASPFIRSYRYRTSSRTSPNTAPNH